MTAPARNRAPENSHSYRPLDSGCLLKPTRTPSRARLKQATQLTKHLRWFQHFFPAFTARGGGAGLLPGAWTRRPSTGLCVHPGCPVPAGTGGEAAVHPGQVPSPTHTCSHTCTALESPVNLIDVRLFGLWWQNWSPPTQTICPPALRRPRGVQSRGQQSAAPRRCKDGPTGERSSELRKSQPAALRC